MANPILAAVLSFILPGIGQIYVGEVKKGIILLAIMIFLFIIAFLSGYMTSIISLIYRLFAAYDAYQLAQ